MAVDVFLKLGDIKGESTDVKHKGEIEIQSFSWGATRVGSSGGGAGAGKVSMQDFHFVSRVGVQSPSLLLATATGQHIKEAVLTCRKAGKGQQDYLTINIQDLFVSSYQTGGSDGTDLPMDQFSLNFSKILMDVAAQSPDGSILRHVQAGWDLKKNAKV